MGSSRLDAAGAFSINESPEIWGGNSAPASQKGLSDLSAQLQKGKFRVNSRQDLIT